ncbi:MAG: Nramp family divalent metal transporter [Vicinamibacterales bacterium]
MHTETRRAGLLPPWGEAALPAPPTFTPRNVMRTVGPGVIGLGLAIGSGEWLLGPAVIVAHGPTLLWITTIAVVLQALLNLEMARYTLYTGEPVMTAYMRTWPGPRFWGGTYSLLSFLQYGWPSWSLASATATAALWLGRMPGAGDAGVVITIGYLTFGICFAIVLIGKKVERTIELAMWLMIGVVVLYLLAIDLATVSASNWSAVASGFVSVGRLPSGADWALIGAFAAYSGLGGVGNAFVTNWMRDKGYGMAATVGYIPTAFGPGIKLSAHGNVFSVTAPALRVWRDWWRFVNVDQWGIFAAGSIVGMALTALMTLQYVPRGSVIEPWAIANISAAGVAEALGPAFLYLTLICGMWVLFKTQLGVVDGLPRAITDILWNGSDAVRTWRGGDVRRVYYCVLAVFAVWGCVALNLAQPLVLLIIGANIAGFNMVLVSLHTLYANRRFLPPELRPPVWREAGLVACALFYGGFVAAALGSWWLS